jgi:phosphate acetyltransferase
MLSTLPFQVPNNILKKSRQLSSTRMAIAGADHEVAIDSALACYEADLIEPVLVGDASKIKTLLKARNIDASAFNIIDAENEKDCARIAVKLASDGEVSALMKGQIHTDTLLRAILNKEFGLTTGARLSHVFHMTVPGRDKTLLITDAAINIAPDIETKLHITRNAVRVAHCLGIENPKVALLSASESVLDAMPSSAQAAEVARRAEAEIKGATIGGPFAFDNAISPQAARLKNITHRVAGNADIVVVPNIETGNALFKMMVYFMSACAAGIVMGAKIPIVLTSRADPPEARLTAVAIASIISNVDRPADKYP